MIPNFYAFTDLILNRRIRRLGVTLSALLAISATAPASAQELADYDYENLSLRSIGFDYGHIWPSKVKATPAYSFRVDLGYLGPGVRIVPSLTYWSSTLRSRELNRLADQINQLPALRAEGVTIDASDLGEIEWRDLSLAVDAHFVWTAPLSVIMYVGAGAAAHALNGQGAFIDDTFVEDALDSFSAGVAAMGGAEVDITRSLRLYGELRYSFANDVRYPGVRIGGALMIGPSSAGRATQLRR